MPYGYGRRRYTGMRRYRRYSGRRKYYRRRAGSYKRTYKRKGYGYRGRRRYMVKGRKRTLTGSLYSSTH